MGMKSYTCYITETYTKRVHLDVPDDTDIHQFVEDRCNAGDIDATSGDANFNRHIDAREDK